MHRAGLAALVGLLAGKYVEFAAAATSTVVLNTTSLTADAAGLRNTTIVLKGHIDPSEVLSFVYAPFKMPANAVALNVVQLYDNKGPNALDVGIFDVKGHDVCDTSPGFRGWAGGAHSNFTLTPTDATPSFIPGDLTPGIWAVILGPYTSGPAGINWNLTITITHGKAPKKVFKPNPAPDAIAGTKSKWYVGDLHLHTVYSDGHYLPQDLIEWATGNRSLDFFCSTEHNTYSANEIWGNFVPAGFLVCRGEEATTRHGHCGALGLDTTEFIDFRYGPNEAAAYAAINKIHAGKGIAIVNHPYDQCLACSWNASYDGFDGIEVWNGGNGFTDGTPAGPGGWDGTDELALKKWDDLITNGLRIVASGGSDAHSRPDIPGQPQTAILADDLSTESIMAGYRAGRVSVHRGPGMGIFITAVSVEAGTCHQTIGPWETIYCTNSEQIVHVDVEVKGLAHQSLTFVSNNGTPVHTETIAAGHQTIGLDLKCGSKPTYIRAEVREVSTNAMLAFTNPVWYKVPSFLPDAE